MGESSTPGMNGTGTGSGGGGSKGEGGGGGYGGGGTQRWGDAGKSKWWGYQTDPRHTHTGPIWQDWRNGTGSPGNTPSGTGLTPPSLPFLAGDNGGLPPSKVLPPPDYESIRMPNGTLKAPYIYTPQTLDPKDYALNTNALTQLENRATNEGPSSWAQLMDKKIGVEQAGLQDQAALDSLGSLQQATTNAAVHGGLSGGGAARLGERQQIMAAKGAQEANKFGSEARLNTRIEDERQRLDLLKALPGMELQKSAYDLGLGTYNNDLVNHGHLTNINHQIGDVGGGNAFTPWVYGQQMAGIGAEQVAQAIQNSGKSK